MEKLLQNKYVLYLVLFIAVTNILGYLAIEDFRSLMVFIAVAALASHFSKNMIVVLGSALIGTNVLYASSRMREGFKEGNADKKKIETAVKKRKKEQMAVSEGKPDKVELEEVEEDVEVKTPRVDYDATMEIA